MSMHHDYYYMPLTLGWLPKTLKYKITSRVWYGNTTKAQKRFREDRIKCIESLDKVLSSARHHKKQVIEDCRHRNEINIEINEKSRKLVEGVS